MADNAATPRARVRAFGLIRDKHGNIKADGDPNRWPDEVKRSLTPEERRNLGVVGYD